MRFDISPIGEDYKNGDIRLVGGSYSWQGRVEIYLNGEWGTITDDGANARDAHVVCIQLGYDTRCELLIGKMIIYSPTYLWCCVPCASLHYVS